MKWKLSLVLVGLLTLAVVGFACGGGEEEAAAPAAPAPAAKAAPAAPAPAPAAPAAPAPAAPAAPAPAPAAKAAPAPAAKAAPVTKVDESLPPVLLGSTVYTTGVAKGLGDEMLWGAQVAVDEANAVGGFNGRKFVIRAYDEGYGAETVVNSAKKAIADGIVVMIGGLDATTCVPLKDIMKEKGIPTAFTTCGSEKVTTEGFHGGVHLADPRNSLQWEHNMEAANTKWLWENGGPKLVVVSTDSQYCRNVETEVRRELERTRATTVPDAEILDVIYFPYGAAEARVEVTKAVGLHPDAFNFCQWGKQLVVSSVKTARELGFTGPIVVTTYDSPEAKELGPALAKNTYGAQGWYYDPKNPATSGPEAKAFDAAIQKISGGRHGNFISETYYSATKLMIEAIKKANSTDKKLIADAIYEVDFVTPRGEHLTFDFKGMRHTPFTTLAAADKNGDMYVADILPYGKWVDGRFVGEK